MSLLTRRQAPHKIVVAGCPGLLSEPLERRGRAREWHPIGRSAAAGSDEHGGDISEDVVDGGQDFPLGSPEREAFDVILASVRREPFG